MKATTYYQQHFESQEKNLLRDLLVLQIRLKKDTEEWQQYSSEINRIIQSIDDLIDSMVNI